MRLFPLAPALILLTACAPAGGDEGDPGGSAASGASVSTRAAADSVPAMQLLGALTAPSSWTGPIGSTITLFPDGTVRRREVTSSGRGADTVIHHGRWTVGDGEARITLFGAGAPQRIALGDTASWRRSATVDSILDTAPMHGAFVYYADAAILTECASGRQYPVAMTGAYRELETRYGATTAAGGSPAVVRIRARLADAPVGEGDGRAPAVIVEGVERVEAEGACAALELRRAVDGVEWRLTELGGETLGPATPGRAPTLQLTLAESRIAGSDGCNRYSGRGVVRGVDLVAIGPLAVTRMMCADSLVMARADRFARALGDGGWLRLDDAGTTLVLSRGPRVVARFVAAQR